MTINISTASVPSDYCATDLRTAWAFLVSLLEAEVVGLQNTVIIGETPPAPDQQDKPWAPNLFSGGNPPAFIYQFNSGAWIMPHPLAPGSVMMYEGTEGSITTFDGGEAGTVTDRTGPMWEKVSSMDAKMPIGPGNLPSGTALAVGATGGEEKHTITQPELPNVTINTKSMLRTNVEDGGTATAFIPQGSSGPPFSDTPMVTESINGGVTQVAGNNLPPYVAIFFIRRTARKYFRR